MILCQGNIKQYSNSDKYSRYMFGFVGNLELLNDIYWTAINSNFTKEVEIHLSEINYQGI